MSGLADRHCTPCRGDVPPLHGAALEAFTAELPHWEVVRGHHIAREFAFPDFAQALAFVVRVGRLAEDEDHHPELLLAWGRVRVEIFTHAVDGLTENDFVLAAKIDGAMHPEPPAMRALVRARDPAHAHLVAGLLESEGVDAEVRGEELFAGEGGIVPAEAGPTVWVREDDRARAQAILAQDRSGLVDDAEAENGG